MDNENSRETRIRQVLDGVLTRREAGDPASDADVIAANPGLMPELAEQLRFLSLLNAAQAAVESDIPLPTAATDDQPIHATLRPDDDDWEDDSPEFPADAPAPEARRPDDADNGLSDVPPARGDCDIRMTTVLPVRGSHSGPRDWTDTQPVSVSNQELAPESPSEARLWRPTNRPPAAVLAVLDDCRDAAEFVRLRGDVCRIGREQGDVLIPHDSEIAAVHCEISREQAGGRWRWFLTDVSEDRGVFVKVNDCALKHGDEFIVGAGRLRFENDDQSAPDRMDRARIVGVGGGATDFSIDLRPNVMWIGSDPGFCGAFTLNDPCVDARHAWVRLDSRGRWCIKDANSVNGVWVRVRRVKLRSGCSFRCGEQLFRFFAP